MAKRRTRRKKIPQDNITTSITGMSHEGRGIAQINGKTTFIFGALPGETVEFKYTECLSKYDEGRAVSIQKSAADRVDPKCPYFGTCGACSLQHLSEPAQMKHKESVMLEHFLHQADTKPDSIAHPIQDLPWGYRRKARLSVRNVHKKNKVLVGFRERDGRFVADMSHCAILHPSIGNKISNFSELLENMDAKESIPQIEIAVGDNATAIIIRHLNELTESDLKQLIDFSSAHDFQLYLQPKGPDTIHQVPTALESKQLHYKLPAFDIQMDFHPSHFTQVNQAVNLKMLDQAIEWLNLKPTDNVLDLFCGIGNFSLPIAKKSAHVVGVEGADFSIKQAKINAENNNIINTAFYTHDLTQPIEDTPWFKKTYDKVLLDPPRAGAKEMMPYIKHWSPSTIVYVSCNPITLARDTKYLLELGYTLEKAGAMDMFPHTQHVEAMALFTKKSK